MILAIDTSGRNLGMALCLDKNIRASLLTSPGLRHGEILQQMIADFLKGAGVSFRQLTGISVTYGPGSFTGLRIGLAAARGYARVLGIPITGISTLYAGAHAFKNISKKIAVVIDARKNELYFACFDCSGSAPERLTDDIADGLSGLKRLIDHNTGIFGPSHLKEHFIAQMGQCDYHISDEFNLAEPAGIRGEEKIAAGDVLQESSAVPVYIRSGF